MPVRAVVTRFEDQPVLPESLADELRESAERTASTGLPDDATLALLRRSGLLAAAVPPGHGGPGGGATTVNRVVEQVALVNPSVAIMLFQHCAVSARVAEWGSEEQQATLLPALARGELLAASAWSETGAGAAKRRLVTTGTRQGDGRWLLNGAKSFTTSAGVADIYLVLVQTSRERETEASPYGSDGQSFFLVDGDNPGLISDLGLDLVGMRGSATGFVSLSDCAVADSARLGPLGRAPEVIAGVRRSGVTLGAVAIGIAQTAYDLAVDHAQRTGTLSNPVVRNRLIDVEARVESARALVERAGSRTAPDPGTTTLYSKLVASSVAEEVTLETARLLGSAGYVVGHRLNRLIADSRAVALMGPTNDLCRELVGMRWQR